MKKINVMDELLANKIAAGEVVERISSVVKELVENSIDASSKNIKVELIECGTKSIKIVDDGFGMSYEDAKLCFNRHATSKIKNENDLFFINTLGFRGEALAAISSVSEVTLDTCDGNDSTMIVVEGGKFKKEKVGTKRKGTIIEVKKLFYNTPARLKFMKSLNTELALCNQVVERLALSHPNISFTFINDGKTLVKTSGSNDLYKTIYEIFGYTISKNMLEINAENYDYIIKGYISNINISKSSRNNMIIFVNGRVVNNINVTRCIKDAYHTVLAENKFPVVLLSIETDPTLIDVNIHPTKQDIKFSKMESLEELLFDAIRSRLNESNNIMNYSNDTNNIIDDYPKVYENIRLTFSTNEKEEKYEVESQQKECLIKPVGLALGTYLVAQEEDIVYIIDIHAANERINYEKYLNALKNKKIYTTSTLFSFNIELTKKEFIMVNEHIDVLKELGFKIEEFGINTFRIYEHPTWLPTNYEEESIKRIIDIISEDKVFDRVKFTEKTAISLACKMSVKANTNISIYEQEKLIETLFECEFPYTCPHGRPTIIKYPKYEFEKLFKRVN